MNEMNDSTQWIEVSVLTTHEAADAVAHIFHELGVGGVVIDDPVLINRLRQSEWELTDIPEQKDIETVTISAYFPKDEFFYNKMEQFNTALANTAQNFTGCQKAPIKFREVSEQDWANAWKQYFHPVRIGNNIVIKPTWEQYAPLANDIVIELDPGMAFGTGTHHTTTLCIEQMEQLIRPDSIVFDVGTGSGILAVIAAKLGATSISAIDIDPVAVRVAKENIELNNVANLVTANQGDLLTGVDGTADLIVANIIADIIIRVLPDVPARLKSDGVFLASGIISERLDDVCKQAAAVGLNVVKVVEQGGWAVVQMSFKGN